MHDTGNLMSRVQALDTVVDSVAIVAKRHHFGKEEGMGPVEPHRIEVGVHCTGNIMSRVETLDTVIDGVVTVMKPSPSRESPCRNIHRKLIQH